MVSQTPFSANDVLDLETEAGNTMFAAGPDSQRAFAKLIDGDRWMIFRNSITNVLHWDFVSIACSFDILVVERWPLVCSWAVHYFPCY